MTSTWTGLWRCFVQWRRPCRRCSGHGWSGRPAGEAVGGIFAAHTPQEFLYRRARVQVEDCQFLDMAFRYVTPNLSPAIILKDEHGWHIHMGIAVKPDLTPLPRPRNGRSGS